jgi:hypothetical protein
LRHFLKALYPALAPKLTLRFLSEMENRPPPEEKPEQWLVFTRRLFRIGGTRAEEPVIEPSLPELLAHGRLFTETVKFQPEDMCIRHFDAARTWGRDPRRYQLVKGYALSADDIWRQHSWVVDGEYLLDFTYSRVAYYGFVLDEGSAFEFWYLKFLLARYLGPVELMWQMDVDAADTT